uniref:Uncharacterized protein n=1 Tax=uncultured Chloroflexota bacterium TaxID=166587 RepID=H5SBC4_9CHLR|nr:hypothetical protein HGMM_F07B11C15 [uncultured Chloroflexota bacterium]BAL55901.1 hypothetical protein HGMM_F32G01C11 [uncultured Chloroflexota bacterium]
MLAITVFAGLVLVLRPDLSAAWVLFWALIALCLPWALSGSFAQRLTVFFCLLAFVDFAKRLVFLLDGQAGWSQYAVYVFPYMYYIAFLLLPWGWGRLLRGIPRNHLWIWGLIAVMLANTWLATETSIAAKLAATALLIMPWTMVAIASDHFEAIPSVWRALVVIGILNAGYAAWNFFFGPTLVELRWAHATSEFSIGADHLMAFLTNRYGGVNVWRPIGFQADSFTLAYLVICRSVSFHVLCLESLSQWPGFCKFSGPGRGLSAGLFITGLGNGGAFLNMYFFLMLGMFLGASNRRQKI